MEKQVVELNLDDILPNRFQPRIKFNETSINELAESIKEHGVIQPIVVRRIGDKYEIIAGERRYKASVIAGKSTIPAIVTELNDKDSAEVALIENVQRQNLTPIEEAISYKKILDMGYLTQEGLADKLGKTQSTIANKLRLLNLSDEVQEALLNEKISERHARSLLKISDQKQQNKMLEKIVTERLTVRKTDEEIRNMLNNNENAEIIGLEDQKVEENTIKNINIPTSTIIEDNSVYNPAPVADIVPMATVKTSYPGFVDVDRIANSAQDINVEKPSADLDTLLKPEDILISEPEIVPNTPITPVVPDTNIFENPTMNEVITPIVPNEPEENNEDDDESILKPGKFFNIMEEDEDATMPEVYSTIESQQVQTNTIENPVPFTPVTPELIQTPSQPDVPNTIDFSQYFTPKEPEPISFESSVYQPSSEMEQSEQQILTNEVQPVQSNVLENQVSFVTEPPVTPEPSLETVSSFDMNQIDPTINLNRPMPTYEPIYDLDDEETIQPEITPLEPSTASGNGFREVIKILRESESKIEQAGYVIEMEEFDFDDMYQVIFKIKK